ncbi:MAG: hypothetical protein ACOY3P_26585 [Planctomycetota bacterium]
MVVEGGVKTFLEWLLGMQWQAGAVTPYSLGVFVAIAVLLLLGLSVAVRSGARWGASLGAVVIELAFLFFALLGVAWIVGGISVGLGHRFTVLQGIGQVWQSVSNAVIETMDPLLGPTWQEGALIQGTVLMGLFLVVAVLVGWIASAVQSGPIQAFGIVHRALREIVVDLLAMSPGRVFALSWLTFKEAIRRRVVIVFVVFVLLLMFAGWYLDPGTSDPARLYLSFLLTSTGYLILLLSLFLSALSLPVDLKNRTIHTVVTKPVRKSEIVLGRILGIGAIGSLLLAALGLLSYGFVVRGLSHTHQIVEADLEAIEKAVLAMQSGEAPKTLTVRTTKDQNHSHTVTIDLAAAKGGRVEAVTSVDHQHTHTLSYSLPAEGAPGARLTYSMSGQQGLLVARKPLFGKVRFLGRSGQPVEQGVNVGDEWEYRSFIEGGTLSAAVWTFSGVTEDLFPEGLPVEMTFEVFRSWKGVIDKTTPGTLHVRNPKTGKESEAKFFFSKEFTTDSQFIPRKLQTTGGAPADLFKDFVHDGQVEVWLRCVPPQQFFGVAQADLYLRLPDLPWAFELNFAKGYLGIWLQMLLLTGFGVLFSTFLSGPIAMLATIGPLTGGLVHSFLEQIAQRKVYGGGPMEAAYRLVTQRNVLSPLEENVRTSAMRATDRVLESFIWLVSAIVPDFRRFGFSDYVAGGFAVSGDLIYQCLVQAAAVLIPLFILGYLFLKTREIGR